MCVEVIVCYIIVVFWRHGVESSAVAAGRDGESVAYTVGVVEDVEDVLPLVVSDDVDDGGGVQRPDVERERRRAAAATDAAAATFAVTDIAVTTPAKSERLVDGRRGADDRQLEPDGELGDDVARRTRHEAEDGQHPLTVAGQPANCTHTNRHRHTVPET